MAEGLEEQQQQHLGEVAAGAGMVEWMDLVSVPVGSIDEIGMVFPATRAMGRRQTVRRWTKREVQARV